MGGGRLHRPPPRVHRRLEGHVGRRADPAALAARRQDEQREAARRLAGDAPARCASSATSTASSTATSRRAASVARVIRELRPDVVLGHDPWKRYRLHPDHRHAGLLACDGVVAARDPHFFPEHGLAHHRPNALLLWEADAPNHVEDVSTTVEPSSPRFGPREPVRVDDERVDDEQLDAFRDRIRDVSPSSARRTASPPPRCSTS